MEGIADGVVEGGAGVAGSVGDGVIIVGVITGVGGGATYFEQIGDILL